MKSRITLLAIVVIILFFNTPVGADSSNSLAPEVEYVTLRAIPKAMAIDDIDGDGSVEIAFASTDSKLVLLTYKRNENSLKQGPLKETNSEVKKVLMSDLDGDSELEILAIDSKTLYVLNKHLKSVFEHDFGTEISDIALGNIDDDEHDEILVAAEDGIHAFGYESTNEDEPSYREIWSFLNFKSVSVIFCLKTDEEFPFIVAENGKNVFVMTYNGEGPLWAEEFQAISEMEYIGDCVVILGKKTGDSKLGIWKFPVSRRSPGADANAQNLLTENSIHRIFFAHYGSSDLLVTHISDSLISMNLEGMENWTLSNYPSCPTSVELFDLDNFPVSNCKNSEYNEIIIIGGKRVRVYIDCWEKTEAGKWKASMNLIEEYETAENIASLKLFSLYGPFEKYMVVTTKEGKLTLYKIFHRYNLIVNFFYQTACERIEQCKQFQETDTEEKFNCLSEALFHLDYCLRDEYDPIIRHYGIENDIKEKKLDCLVQFWEKRHEIFQMIGIGLKNYDEENYKTAAENLSKPYNYYRLMRTEGSKIIYDNMTFSELGLIVQATMAELANETDIYYSNHDYVSALESLSYLEAAIDESKLRIDDSKVPESLRKYNDQEEREKIINECIDRLISRAKVSKEEGQLEEAKEIWEKIEEAYIRISYAEDEDKMKLILGEIEDIGMKEEKWKHITECAGGAGGGILVIIVSFFLFRNKFKKSNIQKKTIEWLKANIPRIQDLRDVLLHYPSFTLLKILEFNLNVSIDSDHITDDEKRKIEIILDQIGISFEEFMNELKEEKTRIASEVTEKIKEFNQGHHTEVMIHLNEIVKDTSDIKEEIQELRHELKSTSPENINVLRSLHSEIRQKEEFLKLDKVPSLGIAEIRKYRLEEKWESVCQESYDILIQDELLENLVKLYNEYKSFLDRLEQLVQGIQEQYPVSLGNVPPSFDKKSFSDQFIGRILKYLILERGESFDQIVSENQDPTGEFTSGPEYRRDISKDLNEYLAKMKGVYFSQWAGEINEKRARLIEEAESLKSLLEKSLKK
ncbi:MAG: hypothetical protein WBA22_01935 [Candidatus Methanofastidiosia archaeon]